MATETNSRLWGIAAVVVGTVVGIIAGQFERPVIAEAAGYSAGVIFATAWFFWSQRKRRWFWCFIAAVLVLHGVALCAVPWPADHEMNKGDIVIGVADVVLMWLIGGVTQSLVGKASVRRS